MELLNIISKSRKEGLHPTEILDMIMNLSNEVPRLKKTLPNYIINQIIIQEVTNIIDNVEKYEDLPSAIINYDIIGDFIFDDDYSLKDITLGQVSELAKIIDYREINLESDISTSSIKILIVYIRCPRNFSLASFRFGAS